MISRPNATTPRRKRLNRVDPVLLEIWLPAVANWGPLQLKRVRRS
jgi:hypothetical protein